MGPLINFMYKNACRRPLLRSPERNIVFDAFYSWPYCLLTEDCTAIKSGVRSKTTHKQRSRFRPLQEFLDFFRNYRYFS